MVRGNGYIGTSIDGFKRLDSVRVNLFSHKAPKVCVPCLQIPPLFYTKKPENEVNTYLHLVGYRIPVSTNRFFYCVDYDMRYPTELSSTFITREIETEMKIS